MVDTNWLLSTMMGDQVVLRLHLRPGRQPRVRAQVFGYWNDDMAYNCFTVVYRHTGREAGLLPLKMLWMSHDWPKWHAFFKKHGYFWPESWHQSIPVVCTIGTSHDNVEVIPSHHPMILIHLAKFQAQVELAKRLQPSWAISLGIVARRLDGLLAAESRKWRQLIGPHNLS